MGARRAPEGDIGAEIKKSQKCTNRIFSESTWQADYRTEIILKIDRQIIEIWRLDCKGEDSEIGFSGSLCSNLILGAASGFDPPCLVPPDRGSKVLQNMLTRASCRL